MLSEIWKSRNSNNIYDKKIAATTYKNKKNKRTTKNHYISTLQKHKLNGTSETNTA